MLNTVETPKAQHSKNQPKVIHNPPREQRPQNYNSSNGKKLNMDKNTVQVAQHAGNQKNISKTMNEE
jgi:hypothetical protein